MRPLQQISGILNPREMCVFCVFVYSVYSDSAHSQSARDVCILCILCIRILCILRILNPREMCVFRFQAFSSCQASDWSRKGVRDVSPQKRRLRRATSGALSLRRRSLL